MTEPLDIAAIERRLEAATPGIWEAIDHEAHGHDWKFIRAPEAIVENPGNRPYAQQILSDEDYPTKSADLQFVAHAKQDIPALLAAVKDRDTRITQLEKREAEARAIGDEIERLDRLTAALQPGAE